MGISQKSTFWAQKNQQLVIEELLVQIVYVFLQFDGLKMKVEKKAECLDKPKNIITIKLGFLPVARVTGQEVKVC